MCRSRASLGRRRRPNYARVRPSWGLGDVRRLIVVLGSFGGEQADERRGENQELERDEGPQDQFGCQC